MEDHFRDKPLITTPHHHHHHLGYESLGERSGERPGDPSTEATTGLTFADPSSCSLL